MHVGEPDAFGNRDVVRDVALDRERSVVRRGESGLLRAEGAAGLRLPLGSLSDGISRRALTIEGSHRDTEIFIPPLTTRAFLRLLRHIENAGMYVTASSVASSAA